MSAGTLTRPRVPYTVGEHLARCASCPTCGADRGQGNPCAGDAGTRPACPKRLEAAKRLMA